MINFLDKTGLAYLWGKMKNNFYSQGELANVATSGSYTDLIDAPQYVICSQSEYDSMASHDVNTYYIII